MHLLLLLQEATPDAGGSSLLSPSAGLMVWTVLIFVTVWFILSRFAFPKITDAVRAREASLQAAIDEAQRDRDEAQRLLADQREQIAAARDEAQKIIADARGAGEQVRSKMLDQAHGETADLLERARREIASERDRAISEMRRAAVDLAIAGASKLIGQNLDDQTNKQLVESYLANIPLSAVTTARS